MSVYLLTIKSGIAGKKLDQLGEKFCCFTKVVNASSVSIARAMAAEDAKSMDCFDNPKAWLSPVFTECKRITPNENAGVLASEYA